MEEPERMSVSNVDDDIDDLESKPWWSLGLPIVICVLVISVGSSWITGRLFFGLTQFFIAVAASAVGALLGFLFGMPRSVIGSADNDSNRSEEHTSELQ